MDRNILDLCSGTGSWSDPYVEAGYNVYCIDLPRDVRLIEMQQLPATVHGILAAPPCTYFCRMRMCRGRPSNAQFRQGLSIVDACLRLIAIYRPLWWALENPSGYLHNWLGPPQLKFDPCDYGDPWTKRTWVWGNFTIPLQNRVPAQTQWVNDGSKGNTGLSRSGVLNAKTPPGFAKAFFSANP